MRPQDSRGSGRRSGRGPRHSSRSRNDSRPAQPPAIQKTFWQRLLSFFRPASRQINGSQRKSPAPNRGEPRSRRKPEAVEVTSPKLYVGNLSYNATESDLLDLFNGVGAVKNAEVACDKYNERSKGFGFVTMGTIDEARRAVAELHDKEFMGRKMVVSGAKASDRESHHRD